jgi:hypothetical protein
MKRLLILVAALALATTACKVEVNAELTVNADKTGAFAIEFGMDDEVITTLSEMSEGEFDPGALLEDFDVEDTPGATVTTERRGDMNFTIISAPVDDLTGSDVLAAGTPLEGISETGSITFTEEKVTIRASAPASSLMGDMEGGDMEGISPAMLAPFIEINLRVTMPGTILDHNADSVDGSTLTWRVDITDPSIDIFAESDPRAGGSSGIPIWVWIVGGVVLLALLVFLFARGGRSKPAPAAAGSPAPIADAPPPPPPSE